MSHSIRRPGAWSGLLIAAVLALGSASPTFAQDPTDDGGQTPRNAAAYPLDVETAPRPTARASRATSPVAIDGRLDDVAWAAATPFGDFVQASPRTGYPASQPTVVRVLYDDEYLYIAAVCFENDPSGIIIAGLEHDFNSGASDIFGVTLDTFLDRRNSFLFLVNPGGAVRDEQTFNDSRNVIAAWDGVVRVRTAVTDSAWIAEMAIPWTTLRFDASRPVQEWGVNFLRRIRRDGESSYWAPLDRRDPIHRMSKAGTLVGLEGLRQGRNLRLKPYAVGARSTGAQVPESSFGSHYDIGGDLKWGLTAGLTLDATLNTDFSQVEVDQEQVNLTRFSLFFPERREFFVENSGSFSFGDLSERNYRMGASLRDFTLFHSRRVGLTPDGRPIPILGGGRLTGRVGAYEVGLLSMQTEATDGLPAENFAVARLKRNVFGSSDVGVMLINREATGSADDGRYNRSYGVDANIRLFGAMIVNSYLAGSLGSEPGTDGQAARLSVAWRDRFWNASAFAKRVDDDFAPAVGYVRRTGMRHYYATLGVHPRPAAERLQEVNPYVEVDYITDLGSSLETRNLTAGIGVSFTGGGSVGGEVREQYERLRASFDIVSGVEVPAGRYTSRDATLRMRTSNGRALSGDLRLTAGEFWGGTRRAVGGGATWRARYDLLLDVSAERNAVDLPGGSFNADVASARVRYALSTRLLGSAFVQYNTATDQVVTNVRVNFRHAPLSDVFLVYTDRRDVEAGQKLERSVAFKVTKLLAF